jgi:hypothetical protein
MLLFSFLSSCLLRLELGDQLSTSESGKKKGNMRILSVLSTFRVAQLALEFEYRSRKQGPGYTHLNSPISIGDSTNNLQGGPKKCRLNDFFDDF